MYRHVRNKYIQSMSINSTIVFLTIERCKLKSKSIFSCFFNSAIELKIYVLNLKQIQSLLETNEVPLKYKLSSEITEAAKKYKILSIEISLRKKELNINMPLGVENGYIGLLFESTIFFIKIQIGESIEKSFNKSSWEGSFIFSFHKNYSNLLNDWYTKNINNNIVVFDNNFSIKPLGGFVYEISKSIINKAKENDGNLLYNLDEDLIFNQNNKFDSHKDNIPNLNEWGYSKLVGFNLYFNPKLKILVKHPLTEEIYNMYSEKLINIKNNTSRKNILYDRKNTILSALKYFLPVNSPEKKYFHSLLIIREPTYLKEIIFKKIYVNFKEETVQDEGSLLKNFLYETIVALKENKRIYWDGNYHKFNWTECLCLNNECIYCFREALYNFNTDSYIENILKFNENENKQIKQIHKDCVLKKSKESKEESETIQPVNESEVSNEILYDLEKKCQFESKNLKKFFEHLCIRIIENNPYSITLIINTLNMFNKETRWKILASVLYLLDKTYIKKYLNFLKHFKEIEIHELIPSAIFFGLLSNLFILSFTRQFNIPLYLPYSFYCTILGIKTPIICLQNKQQTKLISEIQDLNIKYILNPQEILDKEGLKTFSWILEFLEGEGKNILLEFLYSNYENPELINKNIIKEFINFNLTYLENHRIYNIFFKSLNSLLDLNLPMFIDINSSFTSFMDFAIESNSNPEKRYINFTSQEIKSVNEYNYNSLGCLIGKYGRVSISLLLLHTLNSHNLTWEDFLNLFKFEHDTIKNKKVIKKMFEILENWFLEEENIMFNTKITEFFKFVLGKFPSSKDKIIIRIIQCPYNTVVFRSHNCFNTLDVGDTDRFDLIESVFYESVFGCKEYTFA